MIVIHVNNITWHQSRNLERYVPPPVHHLSFFFNEYPIKIVPVPAFKKWLQRDLSQLTTKIIYLRIRTGILLKNSLKKSPQRYVRVLHATHISHHIVFIGGLVVGCRRVLLSWTLEIKVCLFCVRNYQFVLLLPSSFFLLPFSFIPFSLILPSSFFLPLILLCFKQSDLFFLDQHQFLVCWVDAAAPI